MPKGAEPFAITLVLMIAGMVVSSITLNKLDGKIISIGIDSTNKGQLIRSANWFSDSTQALAILAPPVVGLAVGTASGSVALVILYWVVILISFIALLFFGFCNPLNYGSRLSPKFPITSLGFIGLILNVVALVVAWNVPVKGNPA